MNQGCPVSFLALLVGVGLAPAAMPTAAAPWPAGVPRCSTLAEAFAPLRPDDTHAAGGRRLKAEYPLKRGPRSRTSCCLFLHPGRHLDRSLFEAVPPRPELEAKDPEKKAGGIHLGWKILY